MNREEFWKLISLVDIPALDSGDENAALVPLERALASEDETNLESFEEHLSQCLYSLDGAVYAENAGESRGSDDAFLYARCYVVAKGQAHYEAVLGKPELMPKTLEHWCEALLYCHHNAWANLKEGAASDWTFDASVSYESGSNEELWPR